FVDGQHYRVCAHGGRCCGCTWAGSDSHRDYGDTGVPERLHAAGREHSQCDCLWYRLCEYSADDPHRFRLQRSGPDARIRWWTVPATEYSGVDRSLAQRRVESDGRVELHEAFDGAFDVVVACGE